MKKRRQRAVPKPPNLAARALGSKIFGLKVVTPKKGYTRKVKHKAAPDEDVAPFVLRRSDVE
jgi:hypothetical protein